MDADTGKDLCYKTNCSIFSFAYSVAFEALVITVVNYFLFLVLVIGYFCRYLYFCFLVAES